MSASRSEGARRGGYSYVQGIMLEGKFDSEPEGIEGWCEEGLMLRRCVWGERAVSHSHFGSSS